MEPTELLRPWSAGPNVATRSKSQSRLPSPSAQRTEITIQPSIETTSFAPKTTKMPGTFESSCLESARADEGNLLLPPPGPRPRKPHYHRSLSNLLAMTAKPTVDLSIFYDTPSDPRSAAAPRMGSVLKLRWTQEVEAHPNTFYHLIHKMANQLNAVQG